MVQRSTKRRLVARVLLAGAAVAAAAAGHAQIVVHDTGASLTGTNITIPGDSGNLVGTGNANLFHSFSVFNVNTGQAVTFTAPSAAIQVDNVISRVTGTGGTVIDGLLQSTVPGANFFFFNPNGIAVGPFGSLKADGAFYLSTAESLKLGTDGVVFADPNAASVLTSASPSAFGFGASPAPISVTGGFNPLFPFTAFGLDVPAGKTVGLVGGDVTIDQRAILAVPRGRLDLTSVASAGQVPIGAPADLSGFKKQGSVTIRGQSLVDAQQVVIRGGKLTMEDASISPGALSLVFPGAPFAKAPNGGSIDVRVAGEMRIRSTVQPKPDARFKSPNGVPSGIYAFSDFSNGAVPNVSINAGSLVVTGRGGTAPGAPFAGIVTERFGAGAPGGMTITANTIEIRDGAQVASVNYRGGGTGADISFVVRDTMRLSRDGAANFTGIGVQASDVSVPGAGPSFFTAAGRLSIQAGTLSIANGAEISNESLMYGPAGNIDIQAGRLTGSRNGAATGGITSQSAIAGDAGAITLGVGTLDISGGFQISNSVSGNGNAGGLTVNASQAVVIDGENTGLFSTARPIRGSDANLLGSLFGFPSGDAFFNAVGGANGVLGGAGLANIPGAGGTIAVNTPSLTMTGDSRIDSSTFGNGPAGAIRARVAKVEVRDSALIRSQSGGFERDTGNLVVGSGAGGLVQINADTIDLSGTRNGKRAGLSASTRGVGRGGDVVVNTREMSMSNGAAITAESLSAVADLSGAPAGSGEAGDVFITASEQVVMRNASISTESQISGGGDVTVRIVELLEMQSSQISTSAGAALDSAPANVQALFLGGGNIDIDPQFVVLNNSLVQANAFAGNGGNIAIVAGQFLLANSTIEARSTLRQDGTITIDAPDSDISRGLLTLPDSYFDASSQLKGLCEARRTGGLGNSLVVRGEGGIPEGPDRYLASGVGIAAVEVAAARVIGPVEPGVIDGMALAWNAPACSW